MPRKSRFMLSNVLTFVHTINVYIYTINKNHIWIIWEFITHYLLYWIHILSIICIYWKRYTCSMHSSFYRAELIYVNYIQIWLHIAAFRTFFIPSLSIYFRFDEISQIYTRFTRLFSFIKKCERTRGKLFYRYWQFNKFFKSMAKKE